MSKNRDTIGTDQADWKDINENESEFNLLNSEICKKREIIYQGGGPVAIQKQHDKQRMTCRERIKYLLDSDQKLFEVGTFAAYGMYEKYGNIASGGIVSGIGKIKSFVSGQRSFAVLNISANAELGELLRIATMRGNFGNSFRRDGASKPSFNKIFLTTSNFLSTAEILGRILRTCTVKVALETQKFNFPTTSTPSSHRGTTTTT